MHLCLLPAWQTEMIMFCAPHHLSAGPFVFGAGSWEKKNQVPRKLLGLYPQRNGKLLLQHSFTLYSMIAGLVKFLSALGKAMTRVYFCRVGCCLCLPCAHKPSDSILFYSLSQCLLGVCSVHGINGAENGNAQFCTQNAPIF